MDFEGLAVGFELFIFLFSFILLVVDVVLVVWRTSVWFGTTFNFLFEEPFDKFEVEMFRFKFTLMESFEEDEFCSIEIESGELRSELVGELRLDEREEDEDEAIEEPFSKLFVFIVGKKFIESHKSSN